jgi:hypothetical protein
LLIGHEHVHAANGSAGHTLPVFTWLL